MLILPSLHMPLANFTNLSTISYIKIFTIPNLVLTHLVADLGRLGMNSTAADIEHTVAVVAAAATETAGEAHRIHRQMEASGSELRRTKC